MSNGSDAARPWLSRLAGLIEAIQPELAPVRLGEDTRLGEDLGLDSLGFESLFAALKRELGPDVPMIAWFNALEAAEGRAGVLVDLIEAHGRSDGWAGAQVDRVEARGPTDG